MTSTCEDRPLKDEGGEARASGQERRITNPKKQKDTDSSHVERQFDLVALGTWQSSREEFQSDLGQIDLGERSPSPTGQLRITE